MNNFHSLGMVVTGECYESVSPSNPLNWKVCAHAIALLYHQERASDKKMEIEKHLTFKLDKQKVNKSAKCTQHISIQMSHSNSVPNGSM